MELSYLSTRQSLHQGYYKKRYNYPKVTNSYYVHAAHMNIIVMSVLLLYGANYPSLILQDLTGTVAAIVEISTEPFSISLTMMA